MRALGLSSSTLSEMCCSNLRTASSSMEPAATGTRISVQAARAVMVRLPMDPGQSMSTKSYAPDIRLNAAFRVPWRPGFFAKSGSTFPSSCVAGTRRTPPGVGTVAVSMSDSRMRMLSRSGAPVSGRAPTARVALHCSSMSMTRVA